MTVSTEKLTLINLVEHLLLDLVGAEPELTTLVHRLSYIE